MSLFQPILGSSYQKLFQDSENVHIFDIDLPILVENRVFRSGVFRLFISKTAKKSPKRNIYSAKCQKCTLKSCKISLSSLIKFSL